jgi:hypothetical protein
MNGPGNRWDINNGNLVSSLQLSLHTKEWKLLGTAGARSSGEKSVHHGESADKKPPQTEAASSSNALLEMIINSTAKELATQEHALDVQRALRSQ